MPLNIARQITNSSSIAALPSTPVLKQERTQHAHNKALSPSSSSMSSPFSSVAKLLLSKLGLLLSSLEVFGHLARLEKIGVLHIHIHTNGIGSLPPP